MSERPDPLTVLAVCGLGMGSSLILRMTTEDALSKLGINAKVSHTDISSARSESPDLIVGQGMVTQELEGIAPILVQIDDFVDVDALAAKIQEALASQGWL